MIDNVNKEVISFFVQEICQLKKTNIQEAIDVTRGLHHVKDEIVAAKVQIKKRCKHSNVKLQRPSLATCQNQSQ
jgi:hypothetical protein